MFFSLFGIPSFLIFYFFFTLMVWHQPTLVDWVFPLWINFLALEKASFFCEALLACRISI